MLSEEEQRLFAYLSVFSGGFTLEATETIFSEVFGGTSVSSLVTILLDKSLLQRLSDQEAHGEIRFHMLTTIQHFAHTYLQRMGKEAGTRNKHLAYFPGLAGKAAKEIRGPNQVEWLDRLTATRDNLLAYSFGMGARNAPDRSRAANGKPSILFLVSTIRP